MAKTKAELQDELIGLRNGNNRILKVSAERGQRINNLEKEVQEGMDKIIELEEKNRTLISDNKHLVEDIRATESRNDHVESSLEIYKARLDVSLFMEQEKQRLIDKLLLKLENSMLETNTANTRLRNYKALVASKEERQ